VKKAAGSAKSAMNKKDITSAVARMLFRDPTADRNVTAESLRNVSADFAAFIQARPELFPCEDPSEWAPLFHVQRAWKLNVSQGPHSLKLGWDGADPTTLLDQAYDTLTASLAGTVRAERAGEESLPGLWKTTLAETAVKMKKGRLVSQSVSFDVDDLISGKLPEGYAAYFAGYTPNAHYERLVEGYRQMPDAAAQKLPKNGVISQAKKGRGVMVKVAKDGRNTYVQLRDADTDVIQAEAFVTPGKNVTMKVPEGVYTARYATGSTWYGTVDTFGPLGTYTASNEFIVGKNKWVLTAGQEQEGITLYETTADTLAPTEDRSVHIKGVRETKIALRNYPENNPVIPGVSSVTGLPSSGEKYTPVVMVLDNAEDAYPHWGVTDADIIFQVPNAGSGATKLLALFTDHFPEQAGPVRSGRSSMLPAALSFDAAFTFAGPPAVTGGPVDLLQVMQDFGMARTHRVYNLLNSNGLSERIQGIGGGGHNLSCHVSAIHENLVEKEVTFEERPFLFTDEPRTVGADATVIFCTTPANIGTVAPEATETASVAPLARTLTSTAKPGFFTTIVMYLATAPAAFFAVNLTLYVPVLVALPVIAPPLYFNPGGSPLTVTAPSEDSAQLTGSRSAHSKESSPMRAGASTTLNDSRFMLFTSLVSHQLS